MQTEISRINDYFQIKIPIEEGYSDRNIRKFLDYMRIKINASKSQATDEDIEKLSDEVTQSWWNTNKSRFTNIR